MHASTLRISRAKRLKLLPSPLKLIIDNDLVEHALLACKLQLLLRLRQPLLNRILAIRLAAPQPLLQDLETRGLQTEIAGAELRLLDLLDALHLDVEDAGAVVGGDVLDALHAGAVAVAAELRVLDEGARADELAEALFGHEVVLAAVLLAWARGAGCVGDGEAEARGVGF